GQGGIIRSTACNRSRPSEDLALRTALSRSASQIRLGSSVMPHDNDPGRRFTVGVKRRPGSFRSIGGGDFLGDLDITVGDPSTDIVPRQFKGDLTKRDTYVGMVID